jgi:hypothetical protein
LIFVENLTVVEPQFGQVILELNRPPKSRINHGAKDWPSSCLINTKLKVEVFDILFSIFLKSPLKKSSDLFPLLFHGSKL